MKFILTAFALCLSLSGIANSAELSAKHKSMDFGCKTCHSTGMTAPEDNTCLECHGPMTELIAATQVKRTPHDTQISPNPHDSAHYGTTLSCFACHSEHKEAKVYCNTCHSFEYENFK